MYPYTTCDSGLDKLPMTTGHEWLVTFHSQYILFYLPIAALNPNLLQVISMDKRGTWLALNEIRAAFN